MAPIRRHFSPRVPSVVLFLLLAPLANCVPSMRLSPPSAAEFIHPAPFSASSSSASPPNASAPRHPIRQHSAHPFHPMANNALLSDPLAPSADENRLQSVVVEVDASPGFARAAELFRNSLDERVDPCDDFFEFSCGKWVVNNPIPSDLSSYGHFSELREKVNSEMRELFDDPEPSSSNAINTLKQLYRGCMNVAGLSSRKSSELMAHVEKFGYWPIIHGKKWRPEKFDFTELLVNVGRSRAIDVFIDVYVSLDQKNVSRRVLNFDQGGLGLGAGARDYYLNDTRYGKQMAAYGRYMTKKIHTFATDAGIHRTEAEIGRDVAEIIQFEKEFARILIPDEERRNFSKMYNIRHLSEMERHVFSDMNWSTYFGWLVPDEMRPYVASDPEVVLAEPAYFVRLAHLLRRTDKRIIANYVLWRYASAWSFQMDERYDDIQQDFLKAFLGKQSKSPRWKDCSSSVSQRMSYASGAMYVRKHFDKKSKTAALEMIEDLRGAFQQMLVANDWMDTDTREFAMEKAQQMINLIGFPDFLFNDTQLDDYYKNLVLHPNDHYAEMVEKVSAWAQKKAFRRLIEEVDRSEFGTSSAVVNAFYSGVKNAITFPAAILQAPFFDQSFPKAVNYGGIGAVIGHEITHGFDDQGAQFDGIGNLKDWWDPNTQQHFVERKRCIIDQYSSFEVPDINLHVNGILTQGENIADNGGIKQAYRAYKTYLNKLGREEKRLPGFERYNNEQIFFISFAQTWCGHTKPETLIRQILTDPHSPYRYRVNGVVANQPEFTRAFGCPAGARMNPARRCSVW
ncbi:hypothetical protein niasHT_004638 [Heterodera trifolii]|uniref:Uncharacterized protein n=1 Tax=Heterodera trifolii TaxID=157864 RepID=A0ABD2M7G9_9BILA